jgi:uncharacterized protein YrzB (UPF0473 family)
MGREREGNDDEELDESDQITDEDRVTLVDVDGNEAEFILLATLEVDGKDYAVLGPEEQVTDKHREEVELSFFRIVQDENGDEQFEPVDDHDEFESVRAVCAELLGLSEAEESGGGSGIPEA